MSDITFQKYFSELKKIYNTNTRKYKMIYSIDDEGNEYRSVNSVANIVKVWEYKYSDIDKMDKDIIEENPNDGEFVIQIN